MPFLVHTGVTLSVLLARAGRLLNDFDPIVPHARWTREMLISYVNEAMREILSLRPEAFAYTTEIPLKWGSFQQLDPQFQALVNADASINGQRLSPVTEADYKYIRTFHKAVVAANFDGDPLEAYDVRTFTRHPVDDSIFYINPPMPAGCKCRLRATIILRAQQLAESDLTKALPVRPEYEPQVLDWVMKRALEMDHESATARDQAAKYEKAFRDALDGKTKAHARLHDSAKDVEPGTSDSARPMQPMAGRQQ